MVLTFASLLTFASSPTSRCVGVSAWVWMYVCMCVCGGGGEGGEVPRHTVMRSLSLLPLDLYLSQTIPPSFMRVHMCVLHVYVGARIRGTPTDGMGRPAVYAGGCPCSPGCSGRSCPRSPLVVWAALHPTKIIARAHHRAHPWCSCETSYHQSQWRSA